AMRRGPMRQQHMAGVSALQAVKLHISDYVPHLLPKLDDLGLLLADSKDIRARNRQKKANCRRISTAIEQAAAMQLWGLYLAKNCDRRGRVYSVAHFGLEREDAIRACFMFDRGKRIGVDGLRWLKIHLANCGDFGKISRKTFDERVRWVETHLAMILAIAADPLKYDWWKGADSPLMFYGRRTICAQ